MATAASMALPPDLRTSTPISHARGCVEATMPPPGGAYTVLRRLLKFSGLCEAPVSQPDGALVPDPDVTTPSAAPVLLSIPIWGALDGGNS